MNPLSRPVPKQGRAKNSQHPGLDLGAGVPLFQLLVGQFQQLPSLTGPCRIPGDSQRLLQDLNSLLRLAYIDIGFGQAILQRPTTKGAEESRLRPIQIPLWR